MIRFVVVVYSCLQFCIWPRSENHKNVVCSKSISETVLSSMNPELHLQLVHHIVKLLLQVHELFFCLRRGGRRSTGGRDVKRAPAPPDPNSLAQWVINRVDAVDMAFTAPGIATRKPSERHHPRTPWGLSPTVEVDPHQYSAGRCT